MIHRRKALASLVFPASLVVAGLAMADTVTLKTGVVYRGEVDKDNTIVSVFDPDGLKRVIFRDSKIARTDPETGKRAVEHFAIEQPLVVHAGEMPSAAVAVKAGPWDKTGRRTFRYVGPRGGRPVEMTQAIIDLGPRVCKIRGVDGFWVSQVSTSQVPRSVVLDILAKVDQKNLNERLRVIRFLVEAEWNAEARVEVERLKKDFKADPDVREKAENALRLIRESEALQAMTDTETRTRAQQPRAAYARLKSFPSEGVPPALIVQSRDALRKLDALKAADKALTDALASAMADIPQGRKLEILAAMTDAPDAVRDRFSAFEKGRAEGSAKPEALAALALSGWVAGTEFATTSPADADALWTARDLLRDYLSSRESDEALRGDRLVKLADLQLAGKPIGLDALTAVVRQMPPPLKDAQDLPAAGKPSLLRVRDDPNPDQPTEYAVILPPEYHPLRSYPAVIALHGDETPVEALAWWAAEASQRGYLVIAPEYNLRDQKRDYRYTPSEHAAVELALRDARRRFAIDPDRVFLGGQGFGGDMAWDFGLAHPDLFAGVVAVSGLPAKYVWADKANAAKVPFFIVMGDLSPAESDIFFASLARPLITKNLDVTYVEYYRRGREEFPEEAPQAFDWMAPRRREPTPKSFEVVTGRECDDRFYGVVIREFVPGRTKDPAGVEPLGKNLKPATLELKSSSLANLLNITTSGLKAVDVWVSPKLIDFNKKMEVRINNKTAFKGMPKADTEAFLEDLRLRGDRSQTYWMRVQAGIGARN